jgi:hypothetical protein
MDDRHAAGRRERLDAHDAQVAVGAGELEPELELAAGVRLGGHGSRLAS